MAEDSFHNCIGRSVTRADQVTPRSLAEYRATLGPWLFEPAPGVAPPGFHWGLAPATPSLAETGPDGSEAKGLFLPPIPYPRRMWAGGSIQTFAGIGADAAIRRTSIVADVQHRAGKTGGLYFVSVRHDIEADGVLSVSERQDLVFREHASRAAVGEAAPGDHVLAWTIEASPLLLFRFSAFTFNGHRIHYDQSFCRGEGYDGLLVHGPLQAALMLNQISAKLGHVPPRFDYRCLAPLVSGPSFTVATDQAGLTRVIRHDGVTTAEGRVRAPGT